MICFDNYVIILFFIIAIVVVYFIGELHNMKKEVNSLNGKGGGNMGNNNNNMGNNNNNMGNTNDNMGNTNDNNVIVSATNRYNDNGYNQNIQSIPSIQSIPLVPQVPLASPYDILRRYDYRTLTDPMVPPYKRDDYNLPVLPIPTRGFPAPFKKMGTLVSKTTNKDPYKFLFLMGRQKYPGSSHYDYYATEKGSEGNGTLKFDLPHLHKELYTGDKIKIHQLEDTEYEINVDRTVNYEYNPFMI